MRVLPERERAWALTSAGHEPVRFESDVMDMGVSGSRGPAASCWG